MTDYSTQIQKMKRLINDADAIVIGAGSGLSASAGLAYSGKRFHDILQDYIDHYHFTDMYSAGFYPFSSSEEYWGYWSKHVFYNRYAFQDNGLYAKLLNLIKDKNYFVITSNVDHLFQKNGFDKNRLFYMQGDYGLLQCSVPCHNKTYDNREVINAMVHQQRNFKVPSTLLPKCPKCGEPMHMNLRTDNTFVQDEGWYKANNNYQNFLEQNQNKKVVYLELGVGYNTPGIIKYPFYQMTYNNPHSTFVSINTKQYPIPKEIADRSILVEKDIYQTIQDLALQ